MQKNSVHELPCHGAVREKSSGVMKVPAILAVLVMLITSLYAAPDGPIRHVVHFKFKAGADQAQVEKIVTAFAALKKKIDVIDQMEWGTNVSPEGLDKGFTHCWLVSFKSSKDRDAYLIHPEHKKFVELAKPTLDEVLVVDFVVQK